VQATKEAGQFGSIKGGQSRTAGPQRVSPAYLSRKEVRNALEMYCRYDPAKIERGSLKKNKSGGRKKKILGLFFTEKMSRKETRTRACTTAEGEKKLEASTPESKGLTVVLQSGDLGGNRDV